MNGNNQQQHSNGGDEDAQQWDAVIQYLQQCPHVPSSHPAIVAAIVGVEKERQRVARDRKLQAKFSVQSQTTMEPNKHDSDAVLVDNEPIMTSNKKSKSSAEDNSSNHEEDEEDWHAVEEDRAVASSSHANLFLGDALAQRAVKLLSEHQVRVASPVAAVTVVLHAALVSLGFTCTGVPDGNNNNSSNGFAAPVRPLTTFLPAQFGQTTPAQSLQLRYRKHSSYVLMVACAVHPPTDRVTVQWTAGGAKEPTAHWEFSLHEHWNQESWDKALSQQPHAGAIISPILHYKSLAVLLQNFVQQLDLEDHHHHNGVASTSPVSKALYSEATLPAVHATNSTTTTTTSFSTQPQPVLTQPDRTAPPYPQQLGRGYEVPTTIDGAFPGLNGFGGGGGQFRGDLAPSTVGGVGGTGMDQGGNLMGPNHPAFGGGGVHNPNDPHGFLRPRFDPVGPPPTQPDPPQNNPMDSRPPPEIPNHDHLRMPNTLNSNNRNPSSSSRGSDHMYM